MTGEIVQTPLGALKGKRCERHPEVRAFLGIPYAEPPTGIRRWRPPVPKKPWQEVREATWYAPNFSQVIVELGSPYQKEFYPTTRPMSEDGLYLNVWTPAKEGEALPVLVWIHGGAFVEGAGSALQFIGDELASHGVVVVTINYRLGALGFMAHPTLTEESGYSGNWGLQDQLEALRWVKRNIASFGGDPERVTIDGQSAGAMSVCALLASPLAAGLFQRAIVQSYGRIDEPQKKLEEAEKDGLALMEKLGCKNITEMRLLPYDQIIEAQKSLEKEGIHFGTILDGAFLPRQPKEIFDNGEQNKADILAGSCEAEGQMFGDPDFCETMRQTACLLKVPGKGAYAYCFTRELPDPRIGSIPPFHSAELVYQFGTLYTSWRTWEPVDYTISESMMRYWAAFCATGNPNTPGEPFWEPATKEDKRCMRLGKTIEMGLPEKKHFRSFFEPIEE